MTIDRMKMAEKHESHVVALLGGRRTKASGSQWTDQADGRQDHTEQPFAFAWDCKSTRAKSHTITTEMLDKLAEQAAGERPMMPLRWYEDDSLRTYRDWVLVLLDDEAELIDVSRYPARIISAPDAQLTDEQVTELREALSKVSADGVTLIGENLEQDDAIRQLRHDVARLEAELTGEAARARDAEERAVAAEERLAAQPASHVSPYMPAPVSPPQRNLSPLIPQLPWTAVFVTGDRKAGTYYQADGHVTFFEVDSVRVEPYGQGKRLFVNEKIVRHGDLWIDGNLDTRVGQA
jgi:hypothetical protein